MKRCFMNDLTPVLAKKLNVYQDTQLFGLSLNEMRFMIYVCASIRERGLRRDDIDQLLSFDVSGFEKIYGVSPADTRRIFTRVTNSFEEMEGQEHAWLDYIELNKSVISVVISERVKNYIFDAERPLFDFNITEIIDIHSIIAIRFYDFLCTHKLIGREFFLSTDEVRDVCLAYGESYSSESNVRSKLVNQSIDLINQHTSLLLTVSRRSKNTAGDFKFNCMKNTVLY